ncbi:MAG: biopolymer transporter ExbD [Pseudomonadota bacterium]
MALYSSNEDVAEDGWMAEINTTPLVDVMLVLLIIFLLTIPVVSATVNVNLPVESAQWRDTSGDYVVVTVDRVGNLYFNDTFAPDIQALSTSIGEIAALKPQPEIHIRADANAPYAYIGQVIDTAQGHGFAHVSLVTEPAQRASN